MEQPTNLGAQRNSASQPQFSSGPANTVSYETMTAQPAEKGQQTAAQYTQPFLQPQVQYIQVPISNIQSSQPGQPQLETRQSLPAGAILPQSVPIIQQFQPLGGFPTDTVPYSLLGRWPATVICSACGQKAMTRVGYKIGAGSHSWAAVFFFTTGIFVFIPYVAKRFKNVRHKCGKCGRLLATCHYGTGTETHLS